MNSYAILYRIKVLSKGGNPPNIGKITAVAATDNTTTAMILAGEGQTQMAIFGIPTTQNLYIERVYANLIAAKTGSEVKIRLLVNPEPADELLGFLTKHTIGIRAVGNSSVEQHWHTYKKVKGPAIIKIQANGDDNNMDIDAGFEAIIVDNGG